MRKKSLFIILVLLILAITLYKGFLVDYIEDLFNKADGNIIEGIDDIEEEAIIVEPTITNISILGVGDIMFHQPQIKAGSLGGDEYDFRPMFEYVKEYIQEADLALGNYETVSFSDRSYTGYPRFNSPVETIQALEYAGFDILSTANNHSLDQGKAGIISTIEAINSHGLKHIGTNVDKDEEPLIVDVEGIKIGVLSYTFGLNGLDSLLTAEELEYMVNLIDEEKIQYEIQLLKDADVDIIVSYIHWGHEYHHNPSEEQINLGQKMIDWGVNIVFGSHPHVVQKPEIVERDGKDNLIIYSMGNFLSNQRENTMGNSYSEDGVMVKIGIEKSSDTNETIIKEIEYIPTWVYRYENGGKYFYEILPTEDIINGKLELGIDENTKSRIERSFNDTMEVYDGN